MKNMIWFFILLIKTFIFFNFQKWHFSFYHKCMSSTNSDDGKENSTIQYCKKL